MPVTAAVLAGGLGTRLQPVLPGTAKTVARVAGRPFIHYLLSQLVRYGVGRIVMSTGFQSGQVQAQVGTVFEGVPVVYSEEQQPLGTGGAISLAWRNFGGAEGWLVTNGDSYLDLDIGDLIAGHRESGCALTLAVLKVPDAARYGTVEWSVETRRLLAFREKSGELGQIPATAWINGGVYFFEPECLNTLSRDKTLSLEKEVFPHWVERGINVFPVESKFIDIGTPESYATAQRFFGENQAGPADI
jgi:D-glycero-alpha-D-manno-heptose 1-phosphate guanylyltransferase